MKHYLKNWRVFVPKSVECLKEYKFSTFRKDLFSGVTVGIIALPLALAFAIASGVAPERGLFTAIVAGFLISLLGGSRVQIGGPTGAFVVVVYSVVQRFGYEGLVLATLIAAILLLIAALCRLGTWIKYIPYPLTIGFTSGIAVIIFSSQMRDLFGLNTGTLPADFIEKWSVYFSAFPSLDLTTTLLGLGTLVFILIIRKVAPVIPWGISAIILATLITTFFHLPVETIQSRFGELPRTLPTPNFSLFSFTWDELHRLIPDAITIALLAGIESLLSALIADGMTGGKHKSNCELMAQGIANLGSIIFGGIPATGAIARTAANVKTGAQTPFSGVIHAITLFLIIFFFAPIVSYIPLAALAAVLVMIAWNMCEASRFIHLFKAPLGDVGVLLTAFLLTVFVDITAAVEVGMIFAALLFMKRMSDHPEALPLPLKEEEEEMPISKKEIPKEIEIYEIEGPFFFGMADTLKDVLSSIEKPPKVFILRLRKVPVIDASGLFALKEFYLKCKRQETTLMLSGVQKGPLKTLRKFGLNTLIGEEHIFSNIDAALKASQKLLKLS